MGEPLNPECFGKVFFLNDSHFEKLLAQTGNYVWVHITWGTQKVPCPANAPGLSPDSGMALPSINPLKANGFSTDSSSISPYQHIGPHPPPGVRYGENTNLQPALPGNAKTRASIGYNILGGTLGER